MKQPISRNEALKLWEELSSPLPRCFKYEVCGSIRRLSPFVGDCDIVTDADAHTVLSSLKVFLPNIQLLVSGERKLRFLFKDLQFDFQISKPEEFGASMLYFTGSKEFNIRMRSVCKRKGYSLNEYGLWKYKERVAITEEQILKLMGFEKYINPILRKE